jgi:hypothetical protein
MLIGISVGSVLFLLVLVTLIWLFLRRGQRKRAAMCQRATEQGLEEEEGLEEGNFFDDDQIMEEDLRKGPGPRGSYNDLAVATDNFSDNKKLGQGAPALCT